MLELKPSGKCKLNETVRDADQNHCGLNGNKCPIYSRLILNVTWLDYQNIQLHLYYLEVDTN